MIGAQPSLTPSAPAKAAAPKSPFASALLAPGASGPNPKPSQQPKTPTYTGQTTIKPPQYIDINDTEDAVNNTLAKGAQYGDSRYQAKQLDRAGMSRGKAQQFAAQQTGANVRSQAAADAASIRAEDQLQNAKTKADYEQAREMEQLNLAMAQHQLSQANWAAQFARQKNAIDLMQALMNPATMGFNPMRTLSVNGSGQRTITRASPVEEG